MKIRFKWSDELPDSHHLKAAHKRTLFAIVDDDKTRMFMVAGVKRFKKLVRGDKVVRFKTIAKLGGKVWKTVEEAKAEAEELSRKDIPTWPMWKPEPKKKKRS